MTNIPTLLFGGAVPYRGRPLFDVPQIHPFQDDDQRNFPIPPILVPLNAFAPAPLMRQQHAVSPRVGIRQNAPPPQDFQPPEVEAEFVTNSPPSFTDTFSRSPSRSPSRKRGRSPSPRSKRKRKRKRGR